jgi:hypothetical protein
LDDHFGESLGSSIKPADFVEKELEPTTYDCQANGDESSNR